MWMKNTRFADFLEKMRPQEISNGGGGIPNPLDSLRAFGNFSLFLEYQK